MGLCVIGGVVQLLPLSRTWVNQCELPYRHRIGSARVRGRLKEHTANIEQLRCALSVPHLGDVAALSAGMAAP